MSDWYSAALMELKTLLDRIGEEGSVTLETDSEGVAAIVAVLDGTAIMANVSRAIAVAALELGRLES